MKRMRVTDRVLFVLKPAFAVSFLRSAGYQSLVYDNAILHLVKFRCIPFSGFRREFENVSDNRIKGGDLVFPIDPKNTNLIQNVEILHPVKFSWIPFSSFRREVERSQSIRCRVAVLFSDRPDKQNLVEDNEILLLVKFRWIPFNGFREVENVSANQRQGGDLVFPIGLKKHKIDGKRWDLVSCQISLNSVKQFQKRMRKGLSQSEAGRSSCFFDRPDKRKFDMRQWDHASCQVSLNFVQRFQWRRWKCLSQSDARAVIFFSRSVRKHKLDRERWDLASG